MKSKLYILFLFLSVLSYSEIKTSNKNDEYHIGDKIHLKITGNINKTNIEEALKNYKIYSIKEENNKNEKNNKLGDINDETLISNKTFTVAFTSHKLGKNDFTLGNKKIVFDVVPTISTNESKIYENLENESNKYIKKDYPHADISMILIGTILIILSIIIFILDRNRNPYIIFQKGMKKVDEENWREKISLELRKYIDSICNTNFLNGEYVIVPLVAEEDLEFINKLDYLKFSSDKTGECVEYKEKAIEIVERIRKEKKESV